MDPSVLIIIIGMAGGCLVGGVTGFLLGKRKKHPPQPETQQSIGENSVNRLGTPESARKTIPASIFATESAREEFLPLLSVWRHKENNTLAFEIKGRFYRDRTPLSTSAIHKLEQIGRDWLAWLGINETERRTVPQAQAVIVPAPAVAREPRKVIDTSPPLPVILDETKLKEIKTGHSRPVLKTISIAEQIDIILQEKITGTPLANRGIHIAENLNNEVFFKVGLKSYQSIEDIEEPEVLHIIRSAIADWDKFTKEIHHR